MADSSPHVVWEPNKDFDPAKLKLPGFFVDTDLTRRALANYYQDIPTMDQRVGEVRAILKKHGFEDNTLFIYTSDQGSEWPHSKWTLYDAGLHVPFIAVWPGVTKPATRLRRPDLVHRCHPDVHRPRRGRAAPGPRWKELPGRAGGPGEVLP